MADTADKKIITEVKAFARDIHMSPRKVRLVTDMVRGMPVSRALTQLQFVGKKAAGPVKKLVDSAIANAAHNHQIESERLFIKHISVDGGTVMKRFQPRAQGRAFPIGRRQSHINLVLGVADKALVPKYEFRPKVAAVKPDHKHEAAAAPDKETTEKTEPKTVETPKKGFRGWFSKEKYFRGRGNVKGRGHNSFDRRSGE